MDKAQKQLYKTYYRKRNLAAKENKNHYGFKHYEVDFGLKNKLIDIDNLDDEEKRTYEYNNLWGTDYNFIGFFKDYGDKVTFVVDGNNNFFFVNKQGKPDITGIDPDYLHYERDNGYYDDYDEYREYEYTTYYNQLWNTDYKKIYQFGEYGGDVALVNYGKNEYDFLNKHGEPDITGIDVDEINEDNIRAMYYSQLWGVNYIKSISKWGEYGGKVAYVIDKKNNDFFMNKQGELDITGVNVNNLRYRSEREAYNNTKELIKNK